MSYDDEDRRQRRSDRSGRGRDSDYFEQDRYSDRNGRDYRDSRDNRQTTLVRRDSNSSIEDISRDFPPGGGGYVRETTMRKSGVRPARARSFNGRDDRSSYAYSDSKRS